MKSLWKFGLGLCFVIAASAQEATPQLEAPKDAPPSPTLTVKEAQENSQRQAASQSPEKALESALKVEDVDRIGARIRAAKAKEKGPKRFAADLFETRQVSATPTEGGISEDYVLGVGDQVHVNLFGSATNDFATAVDGRGSLVVPKVGRVSVAGMSLGRAREVLERKVKEVFSHTTVDLSVTRLREVRVFVFGEVYVPGSFLVPNLSSVVNVLSLSGGPTPTGSFRDIRILRGGKILNRFDLYPLRAEGTGNFNFGFQNGDTVFVPLVENMVLLEGAFTRVAATVMETKGAPETEPEASQDLAKIPALGRQEKPETTAKSHIRERYDKRLEDAVPTPNESEGQPSWLSQWLLEGKAPAMNFEMRPGETARDALNFAGGFALQSFGGAVTLRRILSDGSFNVAEIPTNEVLDRTPLERGDILTAHPQWDSRGKAVLISGWTRVRGAFSRVDGQTAADLIRKFNLLLPDTYMQRGELIRTMPDGTRNYSAFNISKALAGDAKNNPVLEDRDEIEFYRIRDMRLPRVVTIVGPVSRPGKYEFLDGMRASDLLFRAGVPQENANRLVGELSRYRDGQPCEVVRLNLAQLLSTDGKSPVGIQDDAGNPLLQSFDQISVFAKPDFRPHRTIMLDGQVVRPGLYELKDSKSTLREIIARAGGLTPEAMPKGGVFLRRMVGGERSKKEGTPSSTVIGVDPTAQGINEILGRLNETMRSPLSGTLEISPILHGLESGALNRLVVDIPGMLNGEATAEVELQDGDHIIIPRATTVAYVVGETASPFAAFKVVPNAKVRDLLALAGGTTRNADTGNIRLLKANGQIIDRWVSRCEVEPGDAVLVPQRIMKDVTWQESLTALTPIAIMLNTLKN